MALRPIFFNSLSNCYLLLNSFTTLPRDNFGTQISNGLKTVEDFIPPARLCTFLSLSLSINHTIVTVRSYLVGLVNEINYAGAMGTTLRSVMNHEFK